MKKKKNLPQSAADAEAVKKARQTIRRFFILIINVIVFYAAYIFLTRISETAAKATMWSYLVLTIGFFSAYILYNRGFTMVNRTPESFPEDWSAEKKCAVIEEGKRRKERSKWMLLIIIPLLAVWFIDMLDLFFFDRIRNFFHS